MGHEHHTQSERFHAVQFYRDPASLAAIVAQFLAEGFGRHDAGLVITTPEHRMLIEAELRARALDVDGLKRIGELVMLDARDTLQQFMVEGMPEPRLFRFVVGKVLDDVCRPTPDCTIRAYGDMVNVLWRDRQEEAAIRLEMLWNELAATRDFKLLCGYSMGNFHKAAAIDEIKAHHSHVVEHHPAATAIAVQ